MNLLKEDFRQWLVAKEPDEEVGRAGDPTECPGASWLAVRGAAPFVNYDHCLNPRWLRDFARALDARLKAGPEYGGDDWEGWIKPVTAKQALEVLDSLDVS